MRGVIRTNNPVVGDFGGRQWRQATKPRVPVLGILGCGGDRPPPPLAGMAGMTSRACALGMLGGNRNIFSRLRAWNAWHETNVGWVEVEFVFPRLRCLRLAGDAWARAWQLRDSACSMCSPCSYCVWLLRARIRSCEGAKMGKARLVPLAARLDASDEGTERQPASAAQRRDNSSQKSQFCSRACALGIFGKHPQMSKVSSRACALGMLGTNRTWSVGDFTFVFPAAGGTGPGVTPRRAF